MHTPSNLSFGNCSRYLLACVLVTSRANRETICSTHKAFLPNLFPLQLFQAVSFCPDMIHSASSAKLHCVHSRIFNFVLRHPMTPINHSFRRQQLTRDEGVLRYSKNRNAKEELMLQLWAGEKPGKRQRKSSSALGTFSSERSSCHTARTFNNRDTLAPLIANFESRAISPTIAEVASRPQRKNITSLACVTLLAFRARACHVIGEKEKIRTTKQKRGRFALISRDVNLEFAKDDASQHSRRPSGNGNYDYERSDYGSIKLQSGNRTSSRLE